MIQAPVGRSGGFTGISRGGGCRDLSGFLPPQATLITVVSGKRALAFGLHYKCALCVQQCGWVKKTMQNPSCLASHL